MPKRSRNGVVRRPVRVVAPISVNGASVIFTERADGPSPMIEIELEILHRGIEDFLDRRIEAVDLIDEEHVPGLEIGQQRGEVARACASTGPEVARKPTPSSRETMWASVVLPRPGGTREQHMVERLAAGAGGLDEDGEIVARLGLADEFREALGPQRGFEVVVLAAARARRNGRRSCPGLTWSSALPWGDLLVPTVLHFVQGLKTGSPAEGEIADVARDKRQAMGECGRGDLAVGKLGIGRRTRST